MPLISIAQRIKLQPCAGLKRRRHSIDANLHRRSMSLLSQQSFHCFNPSNMSYSSTYKSIDGQSAPLLSIHNIINRRGNALFHDHYRSYGASTFCLNGTTSHSSNDRTRQKQLQSPSFQRVNNHYNLHYRQRKPPNQHDNNKLKSHGGGGGGKPQFSKLQGISRRLSFFFSDVNLRHDTYARSILEKCKNQYIPLDVIMTFKSIQKWTDNPDVVLKAVDYMNNNDDEIKLKVHRTKSGNVFIGRTEPFHYNTSLKEAKHKILTIEGWPSDQNTIHVENRVRSLLCAKNGYIESHTAQGNKQSQEMNQIAFWGTDIGKGVITIEFKTDEGVADAWNNLEKAAVAARENNSTSPNQFNVKPLVIGQTRRNESKNSFKEYQLQIQNLSLVARSMANEPELSKDRKDQILSLFERKKDNSSTLKLDEREQKDTTTQASTAGTPTNIPLHAEKKWWESGKATPSLHKCVEAIEQIFQQHRSLPPPSREWLHEYTRGKKRRQHHNTYESIQQQQQQQYEQRRIICNDAANLISCIKLSIAEGKIRGLGGKDAYLLAELLGRAMMIFSETPPPLGTKSIGRSSAAQGETSTMMSPYEACLEVLGILRSLNLDTLSSHYAFTIRAACHEARWGEASNVFMNQINGNDGGDVSDDLTTGGFSPINPTLGWDQPLEIGLYAVARNAWYKSMSQEQQEEANDSPSKQVFDAAMKMCMISPSEQDSYVLAAGSALGRAGLWSECLDLATEPKSISTYGPSITAAAMLACIESSRPAEAIDAFHYFMSGQQSVASEWQWSGGNITAVEPICRDLVLTAMGNVSRGGHSQEAMQIFGLIMDEGCPLSCDGLLGLMNSLENDGAWKQAAQLFEGFVSSNFDTDGSRWRIVPTVIELQKEGLGDDALASNAEVDILLENMLASAMRVCNSEGHFGLAAILCTLANKMRHTPSGYHDFAKRSLEEDWVVDLNADDSILKSDAIFVAYMQSLYGLGCKSAADRLIGIRENMDSGMNISKRYKQNRLSKPESWFGAARSIDRLLEAKNSISNDMSPDSSFLFERGLSKAMEYCNDSNQPTAALFLFHHFARALLNNDKQHLTNRFKSFLGVENRGNSTLTEDIFDSDDTLDFSGMELTDSILAAIIKAYTKMGQPNKARLVFSNAMDQLEDAGHMSQSLNSIMEALLENDLQDCLSFMESMDDKCYTPATFITLAKFFADNRVWHEIGEVYNMARRAGCVSEELGFITMQAVNESELVQGKIVVCRNIAENVANTIGMKKDEWITSRYWEIKRYVGYHHARLLMNWNDPSTSQKEELLFAINEMRSCASQGILTKNAPLLCIAQQGDLYSFDRHDDASSGKDKLSERQRRSVVNLILEACVEASRSNLLQKHSFTAHVVQSLRKMKANKECIKIVRGLVSNVGRCKHQVAMEEAIYAAKDERDYESLDLIVNKFEESGYDSSRLLI
ncbi:hypothetical protein ACHAWC_010906 [Mediolabrus comicus]